MTILNGFQMATSPKMPFEDDICQLVGHGKGLRRSGPLCDVPNVPVRIVVRTETKRVRASRENGGTKERDEDGRRI